jgi:predicted component of type VI protein secretion system
LPVLYLHPEFDGELVRLPHEDITQLPENSLSEIGQPLLIASLRSLSTPGKVWPLRAGVARLGRLAENDIVISEPWVSQRHAEIFYRNSLSDSIPVPTYFLRDNSRFGTLLLGSDGWQKVHRQEVPLKSGMQLKFGSSQGQTFEFIIEI